MYFPTCKNACLYLYIGILRSTQFSFISDVYHCLKGPKHNSICCSLLPLSPNGFSILASLAKYFVSNFKTLPVKF